jgi:DUF971 family protein
MQSYPTQIKFHRQSRVLEVVFDSGEHFRLPAEYLRVYSPSAEVTGHGPGQEVLVVGKEQVNILSIEPVGQYAVRLVFDDGHSTGLYSWPILHRLGTKQQENWQAYLERVKAAGLAHRDHD